MRHLLILLTTATLHAADSTTPGEITTPLPNITNLAVEWRIDGDDDLDASCEMKFLRADARFIRWACLQAATWKCPFNHPDIIQIHGDQDPLFPASRQKINHLIRGGDHLMILSHLHKIEPLLIARHQASAQTH